MCNKDQIIFMKFMVCMLIIFPLSEGNDKRLVFDGGSIEGQVELLISEVEKLKAEVAKGTGRDTYVRWGRTSCPADNELVYKGYAGGSHYTHSGGAANWLCLTDQPLWGYYETGVQSGAKIYGGEYEFSDFHHDGASRYFGQNLNDEDAPCVVCRPPRSSVVMIPGRNECFPSWTKEYSGYLVAGEYQHASASEFICLDDRAEAEPHGSENRDGKVIYLAEAICGSLACPPYVAGRELTCVVCSK